MQIGRRPEPDPTDVVGSLLDCHFRIRMFTRYAQRVAALEGSAADIAEMASRVERYFRVALPLHIEDEEASVLPRLRAAPVDTTVHAALDAMAAEHIAIDAQIEGLLPRWAAISREPANTLELAALLGEETAELSRRLDAHLELEERTLFPAIREHLRASAGVIRKEMTARRREIAW